MMVKINIEYLQCSSYEKDLEQFWIEIKNNVHKYQKDTSLINYKMGRKYEGAVIGEYAGIIFSILLAIPPCTIATIEIWEKINKHLKEKRSQKKLPRILNLSTLENLCKLDLISKGFRSFETIKIEKLVEKKTSEYYPNLTDQDFVGDEGFDKATCAKIIFDTQNHKHHYLIDNDGEITKYERIEKN